MRRPPNPTLFPYTTLFRSSSFTRRSDSTSPSTGTGSAASATAQSSCSRQVTEPASRPIRPTAAVAPTTTSTRSEEHTSELQSQFHLVCRLLLEQKNNQFCP